MAILAVYDKEEDVPETHKELFTEREGKWELTGVTGIKTEADVTRIQVSLKKERDDHKETKTKLAVWGDLDYDDTRGKLDKYPELEAAAADKIDEAKMQELVENRVKSQLNTHTAPLKQQVDSLTSERDLLATANTELLGEKRTRTIHDKVRGDLNTAKVIPEAHEDALMLADRIFEIREEDGMIVTRDQVGVTPGITPDIWLSEIKNRRPHWWAPSQGGGAGGGFNGPGNTGDNPFTHDNWNLTKQGEILKAEGAEKAEQLAKAAGTTVGGTRPTAPKK